DGIRDFHVTGVQTCVLPISKVVFLIVALLLIAIGGGLVEEVSFSWASLYLSDEIGAPASLAAAGFVGLVGAQFVGRIVSDRLVDRFGARAVVTVAGVLIAGGIGLALGVPTVWGACAGLVPAGFGCAPTIPLARQQADRIPGLRPGVGLTIVTWLMRLAFLVAPPLVGAIADASSLRAGLAVSLTGGLVVLALDRKSTRLNSSHVKISYAVFCLKKKKPH